MASIVFFESHLVWLSFWHCASYTHTHTHTHTHYVCHSNFLKQLLFPYVTNEKISTLRKVKQRVKGHSARKWQNQNSTLTPLIGNPIGKNGVRWHEVSTRCNGLEEWLLLLSHFSCVWLCATHRRQPTRLPHPWDSPGKNTGVGCHFLLQCMKVKSESEVDQLCPTVSDPMDCSLPGSSVHGVFQARVLEWGAIAW